MDVWGLITSILLVVNILSIISIIFIERKNPQTTIAWVMVMVVLPVVGVLLYLTFGTSGLLTYFFNRRIRKQSTLYSEYEKLILAQLKQTDENKMRFETPNIKECSHIVRMHLEQSGSLYTNNNKVELFTDARKLYDDLFAEIKKAKETINIEYFIVQNDTIGKEFVDLLAQKAREGVEVCLLYDEFGSAKTKMGFFRPLIKSGGKVYRFYTTRIANLFSANHRNHRKIVVIDGKVAYTGGMNIGDEYMGLHKTIKPWRDTHIKLQGGSASMLQMRFLLDYSYCSNDEIKLDDESTFKKYFPPKERYEECGVQIVSSGPDVGIDSIKYGYIKLINSAKHSLYIQTPYFIPDEAMLEALKIAKASGVDVRIIVPGVPDKNFVYAITLSYIGELLRSGIKVYFHEGFIHSKTIVMDKLVASIGTTNFDIRSFALNYEVNAFIYDEEFAALCKQTFLDDLKVCSLIDKDEYFKRGVFTRMFESVCRLLANLS